MSHELAKSTRRQCFATTTDGSRRCPRFAIPGSDVCSSHTSPGGIRSAARRRLSSLAVEAVDVLATEMRTAEKSSDRIRAASAVLKYGPSEVTTEEAKALLIERVRALIVPAREVDDVL